MSKLYDDVFSDRVEVLPPRWILEADPDVVPLGRKLVKKVMKGATVFDITNVSDYYYGGTDQEWFEPRKDFGCVRPPFAHFWMESRRPPKVRSVLDHDLDPTRMPDRVGVLGVVLDMEEAEVMRHAAECVGTEQRLYAQEANAYEAGKFVVEKVSKEILDAAECVHLRSFIEKHGRMAGPMSHFWVWIREDGSIIDYVTKVESSPGHPGPREKETQGFENYVYPALMALDMIHARNVRIVDFVPPPKLAKAHLKRKGVPMVSWKTITVLPFVERKLLDEKTRPSVGVGSRPWQIMPGHYAHYGIAGPGGWTRGKLFGRVSGRFWISEHESGNEKAGIVIKDYKMADPDACPSPVKPVRKKR